MSTRGKSVAIFSISLLLALSLCGQLSCAQEEPVKRVLVLNSYNKGFAQTDAIVNGVESVLKPEENDIELRIEYMDSKSTKYDSQYKEKLYELYKYKYGNQTFELVISSDDNAFNFLREYHEDLFPGTPVVFCGVNNLKAPALIDPDEFTGIIELQSIKETIDLGLKLHPETKQIVFVVDNTPTGEYLWGQIQENFKYYEDVRMTRIDESLSMEQIEDEVSRLSDDTIVLFGTYNHDRSGRYYSFGEAAARVSKTSARPMYGYSVQVLPYGIVGGKLFGGFYHGQVAAELAQRILMGGKVPDIPVLTEPQTQYMFDYGQMQRWGIKESDLPEDSIIVNKPYSFYEENKGLILSIIAFIIVQTLIIVALVVNRSRRKAAEDKLKESEDRFRTIFDSINDAVFIHDIETGAILNVNNTACDMYGYTSEELCRQGVQTISMGEAPYTQADAVEWIKKAAAGKPQVFEWMAKHISGRLFWEEVSMKSAVVGGQERLLVVVRDISERKAAEERMAHLNLVLRAIRNVNQLVTKEHDRDRLLQGACDNLIETRGYHNAWIALLDESRTLVTTAEAGLGETFAPMVKRLKHGELIECAQKALTQSGVIVIDDPATTCADCPLVGQYGGRRAMTVRLEHEGTVYGLFSVAVPAQLATDKEEQALFSEVAGDIAFAIYNLKLEEGRKRAEDALAESEKKLSQIVNGSSTSIFVIDKTHTVTHWNKACENLTGVSAEEMVGTRRQWSPFYFTERPTLADIIVDGSTEEEIAGYYGGKFRKSALIDEAYEVEDFFPIFGDKWLFFTAAPLRDDHGNVTGAIESLQDITERKRADEKLKQTMADLKRSNTDLEQFAYVASHDLQEPLRMVSSYMALMKRRYKGKLDSDADDFIGFAVDGANRMQTLIGDLLAFSRVGMRGKPLTPTDCGTLLPQTLSDLKVSIDDSGTVITHDALPTVIADGSQLAQVFQNLIGNAIKFRGEGPPRVHISAERKGDEWLFSVTDNGIGIDPEYFDRIFVLFQRLHGRDEYTGTGIGLAVCKKIVERHGGRMWVESEQGRGSTFYFTIPARGTADAKGFNTES